MWSPFLRELDLGTVILYEPPYKKDDKKNESLITKLVLDWPKRWRDTKQGNVVEILEKLNDDERFSSYYMTIGYLQSILHLNETQERAN